MSSTERKDKIVMDHVTFRYKDEKEDKGTLMDMSFHIKQGEFVSLIGGSGCGKSTTLSLLAGLNKADKGKILLDGVETRTPGKNRGVVFQHYALFPWMRARKNVEFGIKQVSNASKKEITAKAEKYLKLVGLEGSENLFPHQLSGGMQQRVSIARLLAMETEILLMDEPFGAIDAKNRVVLQDLLLELLEQENNNKTVVFVTHDIDEAILLSDRILFMKDQKIYADLKVPFEHPRKREEITASDTYQKFRKQLFDMFYEYDEKTESKQEVHKLGNNTVYFKREKRYTCV